MAAQKFPHLDSPAIRDTRDALHDYSRLLGEVLKTTRAPRKHWWHASLRPSLRGLTTGIVRADIDFEVELDFNASRLHARTPGKEYTENLTGQPVTDVAGWLGEALSATGVEVQQDPTEMTGCERRFPGYSVEQAIRMQRVLASVSAALANFRAGIREETSPIQVWPHHFDLSMIWLPGPKVPGRDPADEEHADKQMNFGFVFGDAAIPEPYFYVTAYPLPDALPDTELPAGTEWKSDGFSGAVCLYSDLVASFEPAAYLQDVWSRLLAAGKVHLARDGQDR